MLRNYLLVTYRNLFRNKVFTLINILGLGIALSVCIVAFFNHMFDREFDRQNLNFSTIYRVNSFRDMQGRDQEYGVVPATLGLEARKDIPGIQRAARMMSTRSPIKKGTDLFPAEISFVDPEFLDIFTFRLISGDLRSIGNHGDVLLSKTMAARLFGSEYPVGKYISIVNDENKEFAFTVGGVFEDPPLNSSFRSEVLLHYDNFKLMWKWSDTDWKNMTTCLFIQVPDRSLLPSVARGMMKYIQVQNRAREDFRITRFTLVPLKEVGSNTRNIWSSGLYPSLHPAALVAPAVMAVFILLIACFNFANTSIAAFSKRLREIGLRKTFGGQRQQLVSQFMLETLIICTIALLVAILLAEFLVPAYSSLWDYMKLELTFTKYVMFWAFLVILLLLTGFVSGVYPALYVSSFNPASVFRGSSTFKGTSRLSLVLLTLQFAISVSAMVLGLSFARNSRYQQTLDLGYDRDKLIVMPVERRLYSSFRNEILANPKIISAEGTRDHIGFGSYHRPVKYDLKQIEADVMDVGPGYPSAMGLRLFDGRLFDRNRTAADLSNNSIIVNQKLVKDFGWNDPVGKSITLYDTTRLTVIGVVKDFYVSGLWQKINPTFLRLSPGEDFPVMVVRAEPSDLHGVLEYMRSKWKEQGTNFIFGGMFQEDTMNGEKAINGSILKVNIFLALTATILSLIGMYNLVSLDIIKRTKEMGIRRIQGAPVSLVMYLVSRKFIEVLVIASLLGCWGGYRLSVMMLGSIWANYVSIGPGLLLISASIIFFATAVTTMFKILKAASRNPVDSLRYE